MKKLLLLIFLLSVFNFRDLFAQVTATPNNGSSGNFVGWNNLISDPLMIKQENGGVDARIDCFLFSNAQVEQITPEAQA